MAGWADSGTPGPPARGAGGGRVPPWPGAVRWLLRAVLAAFACALVGAAGLVAARTTPPGPTFGRLLAVTGRTNVLIMGLDRTVSDQNPNVEYPVSRTDTLIAACFDPAARRVYLLSIPRDTRALIPGRGYDKINAAHAYGGALLTVRTTENLLGVTFPYYVELHVRGLVHLIDAVGGIDVRIPSNLDYDDNWDGLHIHLKKGYRHLGGGAAAGYARFRHDALGDIGRVERQQQVLDALLAAVRRPQTVVRAGRVLSVMHNDTTTNLDDTQLAALAWFGVRLPRGGLVTATLPGRFGGYAGYWLPDAAADRTLVARFFYGIDPAELSAATAEVVNAGAGRDPEADTVARLGALGVRIVRVASAVDASETVLIVHRGSAAVARVVGGITGAQKVLRIPAQGGPDFSIVLGRGSLAGGTTRAPRR